jgi:hypothetical protein
VLFAGPLLLTGETVVLDHGQGVVSVFYHLASTPVHGDRSRRGLSVSPAIQDRVGAASALGCLRPWVAWIRT